MEIKLYRALMELSCIRPDRLKIEGGKGGSLIGKGLAHELQTRAASQRVSHTSTRHTPRAGSLVVRTTMCALLRFPSHARVPGSKASSCRW